jgi:hypothetical protein
MAAIRRQMFRKHTGSFKLSIAACLQGNCAYFSFQMSVLYSCMVRSVEKKPRPSSSLRGRGMGSA